MALIGEIRKRSWILIVMVGLGMGGFLMMDMLGQLGVSGLQNPNMIGTINGKKISSQEFYGKEKEIFGENASGDMYERRDQVWDYLIQTSILDGASSKLGLGVSDEEVNELMTVGPNLSQVVVNFFGGYQNFDVQNYTETKNAAANFTGEQKQLWDDLIGRVKIDRKQNKLNNLITQAIYTPTWMAEMVNIEQTQKMNFKFVGVPYASISDDEVKVSDSDIRSYMSKNSYLYTRDDETRKAAYVTFDVIPTAEDSAAHRNTIGKLIEEFKTTKEPAIFAANNYGIYDSAYQKKETLSPAIADSMFNMPVGTVIGPYQEGRQYKAIKLVDRKVIPDSVRASHILIAVDQPEFNVAGMDRARALVDSLKGVIEAGTATFDSLSTKFGTDATKDKGGDLGFSAPGSFVKPFNDLVFYEAKKGKLYSVETQFGVHLVKVMDSKSTGAIGVKVAYLTDDILPSKGTVKAARTKAFDFVGKHRTLASLEKAAEENQDISLTRTQELKKSDYQILGLGKGTATRNLTKWLFKAKTGEVSPEIYTYQDDALFYDSKFVVAAMAAKQPTGLPAVADVRAEVEPLVRNQKKAKKIMEQIKASDNLDAVAAQFQASVQEANSVSFSQSFVQGMGNEPKVIGQVFNLELNKVSSAMKGNDAVFVVEPVYKSEAGTLTDYAEIKKNQSTQLETAIAQGLFQAMKKQAKIKDNRARFY